MLSKIKLFAVLLLIMILTGGCTRLEFHKSTPMPRPEWIKRWLETPVCSPPCWEGITPGITTMTDTIKILNNMADVSEVNNVRIELPGNPLPWKFVDTDGEGIAAEDDQGFVAWLRLYIEPKQPLAVGEVISKYGFPSHVQGGRVHMGEGTLYIIYMDKGIMLDTTLNLHGGYGTVTPDTSIFSLYFFPSGEDNFAKFSRSFNQITEWKGYTSYPIP